MAKHALVRHTAPRVIVMAPPRRGGRVRRAGARAVHHAKRFGRRARPALAPTALIIAAAGLGYAKQKGMLDKLPTIGGSKVLTMGLAGYAATRFVRNPTVRNIGTAMMLVAAFDFGRVQGGGTAGEEGEEGDDGPLGGSEGAEY